MSATTIRLWVALSVLAVSAGAFEKGPAYRSLEGASRGVSGAANHEGVAEDGRKQFDEPIDATLFSAPGNTTAAVPAARLKPAGGDFVVGKPQKLSEPKNPLNKEGKPKKEGGGWMLKLLGAVLGGVICGALGFFMGGPVGAALGFAAGAIGGWRVAKG